MSIPSWKSLLQSSLKENISKCGLSATYASIATVKNNNLPAVRTVVMRGFAGEHHSENVGWNSDLLVVITDKRSDKIKEIRENPNTEINWYMNGTMEQYRLQGKITIVDKDFKQDVLLEELGSHFQKSDKEVGDDDNKKSLGLQMFLNQQSKTNSFSWQGERLRHFCQFGAKMRKKYSKKSDENDIDLEIDEMNQENGWFKSNNHQELLEEAFDNFVLLVINVTSVRHWSPSTGTKSML